MTQTSHIPPTFTFADGRRVSRIGYGAMRLTGQPGNFGPYADPAAGRALLRRAAALGIDHFDGARSYGPHHADRLLAEALADHGPRVFVATKGGMEKTGTGPGAIRRDGSPEALRRHIAESRTDLAPLIGDRPIDLYYLHAPDPRVPFADSLRALEEARTEGRIARIGLSNVSLEQLRQALDIAPIAAVQNRYSPADDGNDAAEALIDFTAAQGIAFVPHGPLGAHPLAQGAATDPAQALRALLARSPNVLLIPGTTRIAHLEQNARALDRVAS